MREGGRIAQITVTSNTDATGEFRYVHTDHLRSIETIIKEDGTLAEAMSFDPFGKRRETNWENAATTIIGQETKRGFADHEYLDELGLIRMNGRVYDPSLGRFLSADPFVQIPNDTQCFNRYRYLTNGPLSDADPTSFFGPGEDDNVDAASQSDLSGFSGDEREAALEAHSELVSLGIQGSRPSPYSNTRNVATASMLSATKRAAATIAAKEPVRNVGLIAGGAAQVLAGAGITTRTAFLIF